MRILIGYGVEGVERVTNPWDRVEDADIHIFLDVYDSDIQRYLVEQGKYVWGCVGSDWLELDRDRSKQESAKAGIDIGGYKKIIGLDALRAHLKKNKNQFVKISTLRGAFETFAAPPTKRSSPGWTISKTRWAPSRRLPSSSLRMKSPTRLKLDTMATQSDGGFARGAIVGVEVKDRAYLGRTMRYSSLPENVREVNEKLSPILKREGHRGFISTEIRETKDGRAYLIDPCQRAGSPPSELYQNLIDNLGEVIWYGAQGLMIEPEYTDKWGAEVLLISEWADTHWQHVKFPEEVADNVKLRNFCVIDGETFVIPQNAGAPEIGAVVATGPTAAAAIKECKRIAEMVDGYSIEKPIEALDKAKEELDKALGGKADKPVPKEQATAEEAMRAGKISAKQFDKIAAREGWV